MQGIGAFITKAATTMDLNQGMTAMDETVRAKGALWQGHGSHDKSFW
jgi:hypothetical protein